MKTIKIIFAAALLILVTVSVKAQEQKDFFVGKWECLTVGTPGGDGKSTMVLKRNEEGKLIGSLFSVTSTGNENPFSRVDEKKDKSVTVYFKANGYDVYIYLEKVDENHLTGSTMDMFDTTAVRVIEKG